MHEGRKAWEKSKELIFALAHCNKLIRQCHYSKVRNISKELVVLKGYVISITLM